MQTENWALDIGTGTEKLEKYHEGGFCPIHLGECVAGRFTVLHKLGHGGFGTVWLVRDAANRHGRYVALKVVSAEYSKDYEPAAVLDRLKKYERDHGNPGVFLVELERLFYISRNGRHLCQVFPVFGPPLSELNTPRNLLYPTFARSFAQQLTSGLATIHSLGIWHGGKLLLLTPTLTVIYR
jgi:serine/threonine protein kinase